MHGLHYKLKKPTAAATQAEIPRAAELSPAAPITTVGVLVVVGPLLPVPVELGGEFAFEGIKTLQVISFLRPHQALSSLKLTCQSHEPRHS